MNKTEKTKQIKTNNSIAQANDTVMETIDIHILLSSRKNLTIRTIRSTRPTRKMRKRRMYALLSPFRTSVPGVTKSMKEITTKAASNKFQCQSSVNMNAERSATMRMMISMVKKIVNAKFAMKKKIHFSSSGFRSTFLILASTSIPISSVFAKMRSETIRKKLLLSTKRANQLSGASPHRSSHSTSCTATCCSIHESQSILCLSTPSRKLRSDSPRFKRWRASLTDSEASDLLADFGVGVEGNVCLDPVLVPLIGVPFIGVPMSPSAATRERLRGYDPSSCRPLAVLRAVRLLMLVMFKSATAAFGLPVLIIPAKSWNSLLSQVRKSAISSLKVASKLAAPCCVWSP
mmetsp:Transcript_32783/g.72959  ORF Transcript_32783/g.72959 Transcript_32783/m.72959 type:complete len:347 (+) Transcript_32783:1015-2055(+)